MVLLAVPFRCSSLNAERNDLAESLAASRTPEGKHAPYSVHMWWGASTLAALLATVVITHRSGRQVAAGLLCLGS